MRNPHELTQFMIERHNQHIAMKKNLYTAVIPGNLLFAPNKFDAKSNLQNLKPIKVTDLHFGVQKGKYLLLKSVCESTKNNCVSTVGLDSNGVGMRIGIYNLAEDVIPLGTNIIIKEPFYKEANDCLPVIRVDNPSDCIFFAEMLFRN